MRKSDTGCSGEDTLPPSHSQGHITNTARHTAYPGTTVKPDVNP